MTASERCRKASKQATMAAAARDQSVGCLPLPPSHRKTLARAGFSTVGEVLELKPTELSQELNLSVKEALGIIQLARAATEPSSQDTVTSPTSSAHASKGGAASSSAPEPSSDGTRPPASMVSMIGEVQPRTAFDCLKEEHASSPITTFSSAIDHILGGGVAIGQITEFCGAPGVGKTQLGIQLAVDVQVPKQFDGQGGEALYIDTEGSFVVERVEEIAQAAVNHLEGHAKEELDEFSVESVLRGIHYMRVHSHQQQIAVVETLVDFLAEHPDVKLVVIDSVAFHFRRDFEDMGLRTRLLNSLAQSLLRAASEHSLAIVLVNQMTTKITDAGSHLAPALGETWGHAATTRVVLSWRNNTRWATVLKSPNVKEDEAPYQVTELGIRDVETEHQTKRSRRDELG
eukprot:m.11098 g.11098  ORF g.11098 m.11098 type:complete len:402 (+) comp3930_c0_seq1:332-1537(+)